MTAKTVSLVLGSGGARGLAHIGAIRYLKEKGYEIRSVSGCSIGALIRRLIRHCRRNRFDLVICSSQFAGEVKFLAASTSV